MTYAHFTRSASKKPTPTHNPTFISALARIVAAQAKRQEADASISSPEAQP
jgi:hypothetical protein